MSDDALLWLLTSEAERVLADSAGAKADPATLAALRKRLGDGPEASARAAAVVELAKLRRRATAKFPQAERMFFTRKAYEQATDAVVAAYKAQRFARLGRVVDACCGIGGDLIGLAGVVPDGIGIDADPVMAEYARRNVQSNNQQATVEARRLDADNLPDCNAWHVDPDRRPDGHRTTDPAAHQPSLGTLDAWRERAEAGAVKLAPAARLPERWNAEAELEWISHRGECRQLVAWTGTLSDQHGERRATRVVDGESAGSLLGLPDVAMPVAPTLGEWLHEPDPAVLAAKLQGSLAEQQQLAAVAPGIAYLTSDRPATTALLASFRVIETMSLDRKRLARWLAEREVGRLEIKVRGPDLRPEMLRKQLRPKGDRAATLLIYADANRKTQAVIANRERDADSPDQA